MWKEKKKKKKTLLNIENIIRSIRNLFKLKNQNEAINDKIAIIYFYYIFWNNNYIEYECSGDRNKNLSVKKYLDEIKLVLRDIILNLQKSDILKIQLTTAVTWLQQDSNPQPLSLYTNTQPFSQTRINFISSKNVDEERVMHSKSKNINFLSYDNGNKVVNELF